MVSVQTILQILTIKLEIISVTRKGPAYKTDGVVVHDNEAILKV